MKFKDLINYLDEQFPRSLSISGDNDGVEVCVDDNLEIGRILVVLDITLEAIEYAITNGYNCILAHHPMIYEPMKKLDLSNTAIQKAVMLARHDICAVSFHTRLDSVQGGVNDCLLKAANIEENVEMLLDSDDNNIPIGRVVTLDEEINLQDFVAGVKKSLGEFYGKDIDICIRGNKNVKKIGVVGGSGMYFPKFAADMGVDTFFTGEGKYHAILEAYESFGMNVITAGHFETEAVVLPFIKEKILEKFPEAKVECCYLR